MKPFPRTYGQTDEDYVLANVDLCVTMLDEALNIRCKNCPRCERCLSVAAFDKNRTRPDGLQTYCRNCKRVYVTPKVGRLRREDWAARVEAVRRIAEAIKRGEL